VANEQRNPKITINEDKNTLEEPERSSKENWAYPEKIDRSRGGSQKNLFNEPVSNSDLFLPGK